jgi:hypothetical protein
MTHRFGGPPSGNRPSSGYKAKYEEMSNKFWQLQQKEETEEEAEYAGLCRRLEQMLNHFREDLANLEHENLELQHRMENGGDLRAKCQALKEEEAELLRLKSDLDAATRGTR